MVGKPKIILSVHGSQFTSTQWYEKLAWEGIKVCQTRIHHPESNMVERVMGELGRMFRTYYTQHSF